MNNQISIIEGPPGTGKTQTILHIIANAVMENKTVAVVSNNNSATLNAFEKLKGEKLMSLLLNVSFDEKEDVKEIGARWNSKLKKWYAPNRKDYSKFLKWITKEDENFIICDYIYIIKGEKECWKCNKNIDVIGFGIENYYEVVDGEENTLRYENGEIHIVSDIYDMPLKLKKYLEENYNYRMHYSKTNNSRYLSNGCKFCNALQGNWFLFNEPDDTPFWIESEEDAEKLTLYRIKLPFDISLSLDVGYSTTDELIKSYGNIIDLDLDIF